MFRPRDNSEKKYMVCHSKNMERVCVGTFWEVMQNMFPIYFNRWYGSAFSNALSDARRTNITMRLFVDEFARDFAYDVGYLVFEIYPNNYTNIPPEKLYEMLRL